MAGSDINELKRRMQGALSVLKTELNGLRTGRASAHLLDPIHVEAYGQSMALNQLATVSIPQPRMISVQVWDRAMLSAVEKAIMAANLGLTPSSEGQVIHLRIPELNEERRKELVKVAHKYAETAKVAVRHFIRNDLAELHQNGVKVRVIGERGDLDPDIRRLLEEAEELTQDNVGLTLVVAFNYGARQEIARAAARIAALVKDGTLDPSAITADLIGQNLDAPDLPDPDLIIRTSGEQRLSNFLLWQIAYSELVFVPTYWPDFDRAALEGAIGEYQRRERRFGGLAARSGRA